MKRAYDNATTVLTATVEKTRFYFLHQVHRVLTSTSLILTALAESLQIVTFRKVSRLIVQISV